MQVKTLEEFIELHNSKDNTTKKKHWVPINIHITRKDIYTNEKIQQVFSFVLVSFGSNVPAEVWTNYRFYSDMEKSIKRKIWKNKSLLKFCLDNNINAECFPIRSDYYMNHSNQYDEPGRRYVFGNDNGKLSMASINWTIKKYFISLRITVNKIQVISSLNPNLE